MKTVNLVNQLNKLKLVIHFGATSNTTLWILSVRGVPPPPIYGFFSRQKRSYGFGGYPSPPVYGQNLQSSIWPPPLQGEGEGEEEEEKSHSKVGTRWVRQTFNQALTWSFSIGGPTTCHQIGQISVKSNSGMWQFRAGITCCKWSRALKSLNFPVGRL